MTLIDLSHPIYPAMPTVHHLPPVEVHPLRRMQNGDPLNISNLSVGTHAGTHVDAPWHFEDGGKTIDQVPLEWLCSMANIIGVEKAGGEPILPQDLEAGAAGLEPGNFVILSTGWAARFTSPDYHMHPYLADETAHWLVERGVRLVAVDMVTVDKPAALREPGFGFPAHHILLGNEVLIVENITNVAQLAGQRVKIYAFPLAVRGGDGAPARIVAEV